MDRKQILFDKFVFPRLSGLEYLWDKSKSKTDYLFINEPHGGYSLYFEKDFPPFSLPQDSQKSYCLFEVKTVDCKITLFCPECNKRMPAQLWYLCVELKDAASVLHRLCGQVTVSTGSLCVSGLHQKPAFIEVLEKIKLLETNFH